MIFGIVINSFNNEDTIANAIISIQKIKKKIKKKIDFYIVVIDDSSTDLSADIASNYLKKGVIDSLIINNKNRGISYSRNIGIKCCLHTDYLTFLDGDDELIGHEPFLANLNQDILVFNYVSSNKKNDIKSNFSENDFNISKMQLSNYFISYLKSPNTKSMFTTCWSKFYKVNIIKKYEIYFDEKMHVCEDTDFVFRFLRNAKKIFFSHNYLYKYSLPESTNVITSATFGYGRNLEHMFSFRKAVKAAIKLISSKNKNYISLKALKYNCLGAYTVIYSIRICASINSFASFRESIKVCSKFYKMKDLRIAMKYYKPSNKYHNRFLPLLIKYRLVTLSVIFGIYIARKRYFIRR